jgi:DNA invertase Pin-like site-specific DNA recombinase
MGTTTTTRATTMKTKTCKLVAYLRVSTKGQGESGLGLEGQQIAIGRHADSTGCTVIATYTEVESGTKSARPELARAMAHAKRSGATLVIARLDRLSRNLHFLSGLMETKVDFVACDMPSANRLTLHIMAAVAEDYAKQISDKTKMGLEAAKARGTTLGGYRESAAAKLTPEVRAKAAKNAGKAHRAEAVDAYADLLPVMTDLQKQGLSLAQIADRLNGDGHTTRTGTVWSKVQVKRVLDRAKV